MNKSTLFILLLFTMISTRGQQFYVWIDPIPVTDSLSDNLNASISLPELFFSYTDSVYMVWEKPMDGTTTAIFCRNLSSMGAPFQLLSQPDVHFRNPKIGQFQNADTLLYVYFETNLNGNWDVYYVKYLSNSTVSQPVPVRATPSDEINYAFFPSLGLTWEEDGKIMFQDFHLPGEMPGVSDPVIVAQGDCHFPVLSDRFCAWEKYNPGDTSIYFSEYDPDLNEWADATLVNDSGTNTRLAIGDYQAEYIVWQQKQGSNWRLRSYQLDYSEQFTVNDFPGFNNESPVFSTVPMVTDPSYPFNPCFLAFVSDSTGNNEIFVNEDIYTDNFFNISNYPGADNHPQFFISPGSMYTWMTVYLVWESYRNSHWQLWLTSMDIPMGMDDRDMQKQVVMGYPNPFSKETAIRYKLDRALKVSIDIYSSSGSLVRSLIGSDETPGDHSVNWDGRDDKGNLLPGGIYIGQVNIDGRTYPVKLVKF